MSKTSVIQNICIKVSYHVLNLPKMRLFCLLAQLSQLAPLVMAGQVFYSEQLFNGAYKKNQSVISRNMNLALKFKLKMSSISAFQTQMEHYVRFLELSPKFTQILENSEIFCYKLNPIYAKLISLYVLSSNKIVQMQLKQSQTLKIVIDLMNLLGLKRAEQRFQKINKLHGLIKAEVQIDRLLKSRGNKIHVHSSLRECFIKLLKNIFEEVDKQPLFIQYISIRIHHQNYAFREYCEPFSLFFKQIMSPSSLLHLLKRWQHETYQRLQLKSYYEQSNLQPEPKQLQKNYNQCYMVISKEKHLPSIRNKLMEKGYSFDLLKAYKNQGFSCAKFVSILFIDCQPDKMLTQVSQNQEFCIEGKNLLLIRIFACLKIQKLVSQMPMSRQHYDNLRNLMCQRFPEEKLELVEFQIQGKKQYYLFTDCKMSALFLSYSMNSQGSKCVFKQPKGMQRLSMGETRQKGKTVFS